MDKINALPNASDGGEDLDEEISTQETLISEQDAKIAELIEKVKNKASVTYPTLSNPATSENLQEGYELIDGNGNIITGTHVCSSGGNDVETCTLQIQNGTGDKASLAYASIEDDKIIAKYCSIADGGIASILCLCGSMLTLNMWGDIYGNGLTYIGEASSHSLIFSVDISANETSNITLVGSGSSISL